MASVRDMIQASVRMNVGDGMVCEEGMRGAEDVGGWGHERNGIDVPGGKCVRTARTWAGD